MLKPPKLAGAGQLCLFVEQLGFDHCVTVLDVHPSTMRGWLRGSRAVPQSALMALYWLTDYGFSDAAAEVHWSHQFLIRRNRQLVDQLAQARTVNRVLCGLVGGSGGDGSTPVLHQNSGHAVKFADVVRHHDHVCTHGNSADH